MTKLNESITRNISKTIQNNISNTTGTQRMTIGKVRMYGCKNASIQQNMELAQQIVVDLTEEQLTEMETEIENELKTVIKNDAESESAALSLPGVGTSDSETDLDMQIDTFISERNIMENVRETIQNTFTELKGGQDMEIEDATLDPCGIGVFKDVMAGTGGYSPIEMGQAISTMAAECHKGAGSDCKISQDFYAQQISQDVVNVIADNIQKNSNKTIKTTEGSTESKSKQQGALEEAGDAVAGAAKGVGEGVGEAARGAGEGVAGAAKGVGEGVGEAAEGVGRGLASIFSPGVIIVVLLVFGVGAFIFMRSKSQKGGGSYQKFR